MMWEVVYGRRLCGVVWSSIVWYGWLCGVGQVKVTTKVKVTPKATPKVKDKT